MIHSRFDEEHRQKCSVCYDEWVDFMIECEDDERQGNVQEEY